MPATVTVSFTVNECSVMAQKETTLDIARDWYLWNDRLPGTIDIADFATVNDLVAFIASFSPPGSDGFPVDRYGGIGPAETEQQFFGEGKYEGFGFSFRFDAADDMRITRVFADSPAAFASPGPLARGQRILALNDRTIAEILASGGSAELAAILDSALVKFTILDTDAVEFDTEIERGIVTIDPVPQWRLVPRADGTSAGYLQFETFISTADAQLDAVFEQFRLASVSDVVLDLRYNGGGIVPTAEFFADLLGGFVASDEIFTETRFNADRSAENRLRRFAALLNSINLSRLVVIASGSTASASEMIINGLGPHVDVAVVGQDTFGKPVGQSGWQFCDNILRLTTFQLFNADGFGDYFDGLPVTAGCEAVDDLSVAVGDDADPRLVAALNYLDTGACQAPPAGQIQELAQFKLGFEALPVMPVRNDAPWRVYADAY